MTKAQAIIQHSIDSQPDTFRAALIAEARSYHGRPGESACLSAYDAVQRNDITAIMGITARALVALNVAAKLQGIGPGELFAARLSLI